MLPISAFSDFIAPGAAIISTLAGGGALIGMARYRLSGAQRESIGNKAALVASEVYEKAIKRLEEDLDDSRARVRDLEQKIEELEARMVRLISGGKTA